MGEGHDSRADQLYAAAGGGLLVILGLVGLLINADFATGSAMTTDTLGPLELNGWQATFYLIAGLTGLALAARGPRLYCLAAASVWALLTLSGFFGAHGGEIIPTMGDRLLATTSNNVLALALALLGFAAYAASAPARARARAKSSQPAPAQARSSQSAPAKAKPSQPAPAPDKPARKKRPAEAAGKKRPSWRRRKKPAEPGGAKPAPEAKSKRKLGGGGKRSIGRPRTSDRSPGSGKGETIN